MNNTRLYNNSTAKERRRILRRSQTDAERKMWQILRNRQVCNLKFFRQYSVGRFILDFYCPKCKLAIEVDGGQHAENMIYDNNRTHKLEELSIFVLRFWNNEVLQNPEGVYEKILSTIKEICITPPNLPLS